MSTDADPDDRRSENSARVSLFIDEVHGGPMIVPTADDMDVFDLGELVADRLEANGRVTLPDRDDWPAQGERQPLGEVYWDDRGIPTVLTRDETVVTFTRNGGVDTVYDRPA